MNLAMICRLLGLIVLLVGGAMGLSLPWTFPAFGQVDRFDGPAFFALLGAMLVCALLGGGLVHLGRHARGAALYRREAIAVVGLGWLAATLLGAIPFWLGGASRGFDAEGRPIRMDFFDGAFESASGFSGTGASVLGELEDPVLVPRAILFWRSETHFLGGLGIVVLFVAVLGLGSAGKTLLLTEMPGPSKEGAHARSQRSARIFAAIFIGLCAACALLLRLEGMSWFDALCHAFGAVATGGYSTRTKSIEAFNSPAIELTLVAFMILGCTNFTLLYYLLVLRRPERLLGDVEFRAYLAIMAVGTLAVVVSLLAAGDYRSPAAALRHGLFQVVSIQTNTGFGTADFDRWNSFAKMSLLVLMFIGGCAGSTSCSVKVIRYVLFFKLLRVELEHVFRPNVVRPIRLGDRVVSDPEVLQDVTVYILVIVILFTSGTLLLTAVEPDHTWSAHARPQREKLIDCASAVAATLNGVGPGLGIVGESRNFGDLHFASKMVLTAMMLLGRLEVFVLVVLFMPRFWRAR